MLQAKFISFPIIKFITDFGKRFEDGSCTGKGLTINGKFFNRHVLTILINVELNNYTKSYNSIKESILIDNLEIPLSRKSKTGEITSFWDIPEKNCTIELPAQQIYKVNNLQSRVNF